MRLNKRIAIIAGGANGIGRTTASIFAGEGARVVIADRDAEEGGACVRDLTENGSDALFVETDVSNDADVSELVARTVAHFGPPDTLINCAGIDLDGSIEDTEPYRWKRVMDVNLAGVYLTCRCTIPHMVSRGGGAIVNIASIQGLFGYPRYAAYAASKAGIIGLTRQIAVEYAASNIRANVVSPGAIATNMTANTVLLEPELVRDYQKERTPASNMQQKQQESGPPLLGAGRPEDVAYAALYLASDEAAHVSGHNLVVDGIATARCR